MIKKGLKFCTVLAPYARPGFVLHPALFLLSVLMLTGCSTTMTYKSDLPAALPAKPVGYPIPIYTEQIPVPRRCELIGTVFIGAGQFTMLGGSLESEMKKVMQTAWEKGADAVQVTSVEQPEFSRSSFRLTANLLRYADTWETIPVSAAQFAAYLEKNRQHLDPIEGVWQGYENGPITIGIMRNRSKPGRDYVGFILKAENPVWHEGYKKIDIQYGAEPGTYILDYYLDNFSRAETTVNLKKSATFSIMVPAANKAPVFITYVKNR